MGASNCSPLPFRIISLRLIIATIFEEIVQERMSALGQKRTLAASSGLSALCQKRKDFGYVMTKEGGLIYFHRNSVLSGAFDKLRRGDEVTYVEGMGDTGPTASKVRVL
jgi:cold shock CspA family protein